MSSEPPTRDPYYARDKTARWTICCGLVLALVGWIGHHFLYVYLSSNERDYLNSVDFRFATPEAYVPDSIPAHLSWSIDWNYRIGMVMAGFVTACLLVTLRTAYQQINVWRLRRWPESLAAVSAATHLFSGPLRRNGQSLSGMIGCIIACLNLIVITITPFSLSQSTVGWPQPYNTTALMSTIDWSRGARAPPDCWQRPNPRWCRNSSYPTHQRNAFYYLNMTAYNDNRRKNLEQGREVSIGSWLNDPANFLKGGLYGGPSEDLIRTAINAAITDEIATNPLVLPGVSYQGSFHGPAVRCKNATTDPSTLAHLQDILQADNGTWYHSWVPSNDTNRKLVHNDLGTSPPELDLVSTDAARLFMAFRRAWDYRPGDEGIIYECALYNASYSVSYGFNAGSALHASLQSSFYNGKLPEPRWDRYMTSPDSKVAFVRNITYLHPVASIIHTVGSEYKESVQASNDTLLQIEAHKSYMAVMQSLGRILVGSVRQDPSSPYLDNAQSIRTLALQTRLTESILDQERLNFRDTEPMAYVENMMAGIVESMLADPVFTIPMNQTITMWRPLYLLHYEPLQLHVPYTIVFGLVFLVSILGLIATKSNGTSFSLDFKSIVLASTELEPTLRDADSSGDATGLKVSRLNDVKVSMIATTAPNDVSAKKLARLDGGNGAGEPIPLLKRRLKFIFDGPGMDGSAGMGNVSLPLAYGVVTANEERRQHGFDERDDSKTAARVDIMPMPT